MFFKNVLSCSILAVILIAMVSVEAADNFSDNPSKSVREFINPDGRFDLDSLRKSGYQGVLDLTGLKVQLDPITGEPMVQSAPTNSSSPVPDDVYWDNSISNSLPGVNSTVFAMTSFNGKLIVGGQFTVAGDKIANNIAAWNGSSWSTLGTGVNNSVRALTVFDGDLIVGGLFTEAGGITTNNIAAWDGSTWSPIGTGLNGHVFALTVYDSNLFAGGSFDSSGSTEINHIASWNGLKWSPLGTGVDNSVLSLIVYNNGLIATGRFLNAGGLSVNCIASWDGSNWSSLRYGLGGGGNALTVYKDKLIVGGGFRSVDSIINAVNIAAWDGSTWSRPWFNYVGLNSPVRTLSAYKNVLFVGVGGMISLGVGFSTRYLASWNGTSWKDLSAVTRNPVHSLFCQDSILFVGASISVAEPNGSLNIVSWDGNSWLTCGAGSVGFVGSFVSFRGDLIAGGIFRFSNDTNNSFIASWDGTKWNPLGNGPNGYVHALTVFGNRLIAGGWFTNAGVVAASNIAAWDGTNWSALDSGLGSIVYALAVYKSKLYAGSNGVYSWDGTSWSPPDTVQGPDSTVRALITYDNGLIAAGDFVMVGEMPVNHIAAWNGSNWDSLGSGLGYPFYGSGLALAVLENTLVAGGFFAFYAGEEAAFNIASWDGASWSAMDSGLGGAVYALATFDNMVIAGGDNFYSDERKTIASWDGSSWNPLGSGTNGLVRSMFSTGSALFVGGKFTIVGADKVAGSVAKWTKRIATGIEDNEFTQLPTDHKLSQNYPNPFNPETVIEFELPRRTRVRLSVFNILGQEVAELLNEEVSAGSHRVTWDGKSSAGKSLASGIYFYRIVAEDFAELKKMILIK